MPKKTENAGAVEPLVKIQCPECGDTPEIRPVCAVCQGIGEISIESVCLAIAEMAINCESDLTGDHRENYNPRILFAMKALAQIFPAGMAKALQKAKLF